MIIECARDMMPFMTIFLISMLAFSSAFGAIDEIIYLKEKESVRLIDPAAADTVDVNFDFDPEETLVLVGAYYDTYLMP